MIKKEKKLNTSRNMGGKKSKNIFIDGWNWQQKGLTGNHNTNDVPLMKSDQCVVYDPNDDKMEIKTSACPTAKGICKYKLIEQHEPIGNNVEYNIMSR